MVRSPVAGLSVRVHQGPTCTVMSFRLGMSDSSLVSRTIERLGACNEYNHLKQNLIPWPSSLLVYHARAVLDVGNSGVRDEGSPLLL